MEFLMKFMIVLLCVSKSLSQTPDPQTLQDIFGNPDDIMVSSTTGVTTIEREGEKCICVPYYLCDPDGKQIIQDGSLDGFGQLDVRFRDECSESVDVCCKEPRSPDNPIIPVPKPDRPTGCGIRNELGVDFQILNGLKNDSEFAEFPWTVAILSSADGSSVCVGSLIHPQVVLTGAHCLKKYRPIELKARAGEWDTQTIKERLPYQEKTISSFVLHPQFNDKTLANDVGLMFLKEPYAPADNINTICLPNQDENLENVKQCYATGWGKTRFGKTGRYSIIMKKVVLDMVSHNKCEQQFQRTRLGPRFKLHKTFICAGGKEGVDTCEGDGGAPLACPKANGRYQQAGIVAWGIGCGEKDVSGAYGYVSKFRSWIDNEMKKANYDIKSYTV